MARPRKKKTDFLDEKLSEVQQDEVLSMPLETYEDYKAYNSKARAMNKKFGYCRYQVKPCPEELHPKQRVIFNRNDQPTNPLPVYMRNHLIEFKKTLYPGKAYDLPLCVIEYLGSKGVPIWKWFDNPDGSKETRIAQKDPRFSLRSVFSE